MNQPGFGKALGGGGRRYRIGAANRAAMIFDPELGMVLRNGDRIPLSPREAAVLGFLLRRPRQVVGRDELIHAVWDGKPVADEVVAKAIRRVRRALGDDASQPAFIATLPRRGYQFIGAVAELSGSESARRMPWMLGLVGLVAAVAGLAVGLWWAGGEQMSGMPARRIPLALPEPLLLPASAGSALAASSDGTTLVYVARGTDETSYLLALNLSDGTAHRVPGSEGSPSSPSLSPDGRRVAFFDRGGLMVGSMSADSERARRVADVAITHAPGGVWLDDGHLLYTSGVGSGLWMLDLQSGAREPVTRLAEGERGHLWPSRTADGRGTLFCAPATEAGWLDGPILWLRDGERVPRVLLERGGAKPQMSSDGSLWFARGRELLHTDGTDPSAPGRLQTVRSDLLAVASSSPQFAVAANGGVFAVIRPSSGGKATLYWRDLYQAQAWRLDRTEGRRYRGLRISPDGRRLASSIDGDVWIYEFSTDEFTRLAGTNALELDPVWDADSGAVAFASDAQGTFDLMTVQRQQPGTARVLWQGPGDQLPESFSPDGRYLLYTDRGSSAGTGADLWRLDLQDGQVEPLWTGPGDDTSARYSPDGRWIAFVSNRSGRDEIYLLGADGGEPIQLTQGGGASPAWDVNGNAIAFRRFAGYTTAHFRLGAGLEQTDTRVRAIEPVPGFEFDLTLDGILKPLVAWPEGPGMSLVWYDIGAGGQELDTR